MTLCSSPSIGGHSSCQTTNLNGKGFAKALKIVVAFRLLSWLWITNPQMDMQAYIEALSFDVQSLFNAMSDSTLQQMDKSIKASMILGVLV